MRVVYIADIIKKPSISIDDPLIIASGELKNRRHFSFYCKAMNLYITS